MGAPQHSILFLHMLKALITTITEHHWLTPFYSSHRSIPHLCREQARRASIKTPGSNPQPTVVQELWTGASLALNWDKSQVCYKLFPRAPLWGWVPLAHSGHWFHDLLLTAFFPFLALLPHLPTSVSWDHPLIKHLCSNPCLQLFFSGELKIRPYPNTMLYISSLWLGPFSPSAHTSCTYPLCQSYPPFKDHPYQYPFGRIHPSQELCTSQ